MILKKIFPISLMAMAMTVGLISSGCSGDDSGDNSSKGPSVQEQYPIPLSQLNHLDPFFFPDEESQMYYHVYPRYNPNGTPAALDLYESPNLTDWRKAGVAWEPSKDFLGNADCWAPDIYKWKGKHYIFVTFSRLKDITDISHWNLSNFEIHAGVTVLVSDSGPRGPYRENVPKGTLNVTPAEWNCIDGSFYVDNDGNPWMIYSGELSMFYEGRVYAQRMNDDLSALVGEPHLLFTSNAFLAPWIWDSGIRDGKRVFITDAPYVWKDDESGNLIMIWSGNSISGYAIGQAISTSGDILGPWEQEPERLNADTGGHAHVFRDLNGTLRISYHTKNFGQGPYVTTVKPIFISDGKFQKIN